MSPALTRRGLVQAGAAALGTMVAGTSVTVQAAPDPDAGLLDLIASYAEVAAERNAHASIHEAAEERFKASAPPRPAALTETFSDILDHVTSTGCDKHSDGRPWPYFTPGDVERLRAAGPVMGLVWSEDGRPLPLERNPRGEARRLEILAAHDAWKAEVRVLADLVGRTAAEAEDDHLYAAVWPLREAIRGTRPVTITGLCAKARWVVALADWEEDGEQVVRDLAAFGQVTS